MDEGIQTPPNGPQYQDEKGKGKSKKGGGKGKTKFNKGAKRSHELMAGGPVGGPVQPAFPPPGH